ncbi:GNAT family N-acetyltransferase [Streptomyces armeniacus]|uniref:GNAT family N-acetyltransferase n=1 Tax=Streptomyces armeniacus TaxID=83291 RepID=A0A345XJM4_9ACTN|nr:GNAT family N-acetyltransferase [Streptomyces armeniacus]AXK31840.1 GNAT family N-acetyltransferase [Streptomyces armeniacus]
MFRLRPLAPADLGLILDLQERVRSSLDDPGIFQLSTPEFVSYCLGGGGKCYAVTHGAETVAYRIVYFPRGRDFNLAKDTPLPSAEYPYVGHWDTVAVLPEWRGHGLARLMNARALADLSETEIRHLFATSSPNNPHGVRSLLETGFRPFRLVRKFGGRLRFLFYRPTPADWPAMPDGGDERHIGLDAVSELERAFDAGWTGTGIEHHERDGASLRMRRCPLPYGIRCESIATPGTEGGPR